MLSNLWRLNSCLKILENFQRGSPTIGVPNEYKHKSRMRIRNCSCERGLWKEYRAAPSLYGSRSPRRGVSYPRSQSRTAAIEGSRARLPGSNPYNHRLPVCDIGRVVNSLPRPWFPHPYLEIVGVSIIGLGMALNSLISPISPLLKSELAYDCLAQ